MLELNYEQAKEVRKALSLLMRTIEPIAENEDRFNLLENLYDEVSEIEDNLEKTIDNE